ncbi:MAG: glycosyltransferase family 1 protein [Chloroflexi bacterium]|nr:glycosyltransferase family 1 protein [Chloroflexota bacterium]
MHITILALGSRGDVQPLVALGKGLKQAGHEVRLATFENFAQLVMGAGLDYHKVPGNSQDILDGVVGFSEDDLFSGMTDISVAFSSLIDEYVEAFSSPHLLKTDLVINQLPSNLFGWDIAEAAGVPYISAAVIPLTETADFPLLLFPSLPLGGGYYRFTYRLSNFVGERMLSSAVDQVRQRFGLPSQPFWGHYSQLQEQKVPVLYGISPAVLPRPADWGEHIHIVGYWSLDDAADFNPPDDLLAFLDAGPAPVFIGFGSMPVQDPESTTRILIDALEKSGQRGILSRGWAAIGAEALPDSIHVVDYVPYSWLFPRMAAVVHHGGSGTTGAALGSGVPSLVVAFVGDQPYWGARTRDLGVGPGPIRFRDLDVDRLAYAIRIAATHPGMRERAAALGEKIRAEDGISAAVEVIEQVAERGPLQPKAN